MFRLKMTVSLTVLVSVVVSLLAPVVSARQTANVSTPEAASVFYSELEAAGSFAMLYRWMHPDAQAVVPETAVVGWYTNEFAPNGPGVITVTGVQMTSWTWDVTGTTYPNTAVVSFRQPFANGTVVEDVVRLVESNGEWRWFFGRSRAFIDEQIATYGSTTTVSADACADAAAWWAATYPRTLSADYFSYAFPSIWNGGSVSSEVMASYADLFGRLHDEQSRLSTPSTALPVQTKLLAILDAYQIGASNLAIVTTGNLNPLAASATLSVGIQKIDEGGSELLSLGTTVEAFLDTCDPVVVFVSGQGDDLPIGVLPGQVGAHIPAVECRSFASQADAQRFFEAAQPGDPHRLDPDGDGAACRSF